jgi:hypothetical protein
MLHLLYMVITSMPITNASLLGSLLDSKKKRNSEEQHVRRTSVFHQHVDWPTFQSPGDLKRSPQWSAYLTAVYGESVMSPQHYPIDVSMFWVLYTSHLNSSGLSRLLLSDREHREGCPKEEGDLYFAADGGPAHEGTVWIYHRSPPQGLSRDTWVEVSHVKDEWEPTGFWMYWAPGSGVFYHLGETEVYKNHYDAHKKMDMLEDSVLPGTTTAKSFQFLQHGDMDCGDTSIEILDLHHAGTSSCMDGFAAGWAADCTCICHADQVATSCTPDCSALEVGRLGTSENHERDINEP